MARRHIGVEREVPPARHPLEVSPVVLPPLMVTASSAPHAVAVARCHGVRATAVVHVARGRIGKRRFIMITAAAIVVVHHTSQQRRTRQPTTAAVDVGTVRGRAVRLRRLSCDEYACEVDLLWDAADRDRNYTIDTACGCLFAHHEVGHVHTNQRIESNLYFICSRHKKSCAKVSERK